MVLEFFKGEIRKKQKKFSQTGNIVPATVFEFFLQFLRDICEKNADKTIGSRIQLFYPQTICQRDNYLLACSTKPEIILMTLWASSAVIFCPLISERLNATEVELPLLGNDRYQSRFSEEVKEYKNSRKNQCEPQGDKSRKKCDRSQNQKENRFEVTADQITDFWKRNDLKNSSGKRSVGIFDPVGINFKRCGRVDPNESEEPIHETGFSAYQTDIAGTFRIDDILSENQWGSPLQVWR